MSLADLKFRIRNAFISHRTVVQDATLFIAGAVSLALVALEYNFFDHEDLSITHETFENALGASAFISLSMFVFAVRRLREQRRELKRRVAAEQHVRELACRDPLTGLPNRRRFHEELRAAIASPPRAGGSHAVFLLDLNGFKSVNDVFGHPVGDDVLTVVGQRIRAAIDEHDMIARLGGDEFVVLSKHLASADAATSIALRIMRCFDDPIVTSAGKHQVGVGIGIALLPRDGDSDAEIIRRADIALYRAKAEQGSALCFFEEEMDACIRERDLIERELRSAIGTHAIYPHYQSLVDLQTGAVVGFEALARWTHPTLGEIPPDRFIPIAEDCGLIRELSNHLLSCACRDARDWPPDVTLSFNISPVQMQDRTLGLRILGILSEIGLSPLRLEIEITESALVRDLAAAQEVLGALRDAGVRIALDDFGTGYSSLYHLRNFKFDKIKIDRCFIANMQSEPESAAIVRALVGLGDGLGVTITAEGIEEPAQHSALAEQGCEQGQGFLFSRPVSATEARSLFESSTPERAVG